MSILPRQSKRTMESDRVFIDTGAWLAVIDQKDQYHEPARSFYGQAIREGIQFVTTNLVIAETYTLTRRRLGHRTAIQFLDLIETSHRLMGVWSTPELEVTAVKTLRRYEDQRFSYVDAVSFAVMGAHQLQTAFTFDHHFDVMGFTKRPSPS
jgi:predicted nucleic acid-binding protein